jgi:Lar family restriction alleviation protein
MSEELKPCPFCGEDEARSSLVCGEFAIMCNNCDGCTTYLDAEHEAIAAWNRRTPDLSTMREALDEAEKALQDSKDFILGQWPDVECNTIDKALARLRSVREVKNG